MTAERPDPDFFGYAQWQLDVSAGHRIAQELGKKLSEEKGREASVGELIAHMVMLPPEERRQCNAYVGALRAQRKRAGDGG